MNTNVKISMQAYVEENALIKLVLMVLSESRLLI